MSTAKEKAIERARYWVDNQVKWIERCGGDLEGYLRNYRQYGRSDQNITDIYNADMGVLRDYRKSLSALVPPTNIAVFRVTTEPGGHVVVEATCGHTWGHAGLNPPSVGDKTDCLTCDVRRAHLAVMDQRAEVRREQRHFAVRR